MTNPFNGSGVALVTPFDVNGKIDFNALEQLVQFQIDGKTDFLVVQGTTGESPTLSDAEKTEVLQCVMSKNDKMLPIVYGVGGNNTVVVGEKLKQVPSGVDGILSVSPYYNKPIQNGILAHYRHLAQCTDLPIILYNVPGRTGSNVLPETTLTLAEIPNIVAMKEASGNMEQIMEIIRLRKPDFGVLSGDDAITMPLMAAGANGVISVVSNAFPEKFNRMVHAAQTGDFETARKEHYDLMPITKMLFEEGNPGGVKVALEVRGICQSHMRLPLFPVSDGLRNRIIKETERILSLS